MRKEKNKVQRKGFFRFIKAILRIFVKKTKILTANEQLDTNAIYLSNHIGAKGPVSHELYFPHNFKFWGTHEMVFTYKERWHYLAEIYFPNKKHKGKFVSKIIATLVLPFISLFYRGMQLIPTYTDARLIETIKFSVDYLKKGNSIIIFPENSSDGYHEHLTEYYAGFILLAKQYFKKTGKDIKIYNMYLRKRDKVLIIDNPVHISEILKDNRDMREIANDFKDRANQLSTFTSVEQLHK